MGESDVLDVVGDPDRLGLLERLGLLDTPAEPAFDRLTRLASRLLDTPVALVSIVDADRQFFKSQVGLPEPWATRRETPLDHSFCKHVVATGEPLVVDDAPSHPLVRDNLAVPHLGVTAYLGIPLRFSTGHVLGAMCAIDGKCRDWSAEQIATLRDLAAAVTTEIELRNEIAARRRAEEKMRVAMELAQAGNRSKSEFLTKMSHELRTPLNSVIGFANLLSKNPVGKLDRRELTFLERIRDNGQHLLGLINGLLDLSRIESGRMELEWADVDLGPLVEAVLAQIHCQVEDKPVRLEARIAEGALPLRADAGRLKQVLINLVGNAIKFTERGSVTVRLVVDDDRRPRTLAVADTGIGVPLDRQRTIFEPFRQADDTLARRHGGSGLGLSISRALVEQMGFALSLESTVGRGSTFTIDFRPDGAG